jgi:hypothetical protein
MAGTSVKSDGDNLMRVHWTINSRRLPFLPVIGNFFEQIRRDAVHFGELRLVFGLNSH